MLIFSVPFSKFDASKISANSGPLRTLEKMIRIITIEREYGSGAAAIAAKLADRLGWNLWDQLLTEEIARLAHCEWSAVEKQEERRDPHYYLLPSAQVFRAWKL